MGPQLSPAPQAAHHQSPLAGGASPAQAREGKSLGLPGRVCVPASSRSLCTPLQFNHLFPIPFTLTAAHQLPGTRR